MKLYNDEHIKEVAHKSLLHEGPSLSLDIRFRKFLENPLDLIFREWNGEKPPADGAEMTFHYSLSKNKLGEEEIDLAP